MLIICDNFSPFMISSWTHKLSTGWNNLSCSFRFSAVIFATAEPLTSSARFEGSKPVARSDYSDFLHCWWFVRQVGFYLVQSVHRSRVFMYSLGTPQQTRFANPHNFCSGGFWARVSDNPTNLCYPPLYPSIGSRLQIEAAIQGFWKNGLMWSWWRRKV